jgi:hypothetical protein
MGTVEKFPFRHRAHHHVEMSDAQVAAEDRLFAAMDALTIADGAVKGWEEGAEARPLYREFDNCAQEFVCAYLEHRRLACEGL